MTPLESLFWNKMSVKDSLIEREIIVWRGLSTNNDAKAKIKKKEKKSADPSRILQLDEPLLEQFFPSSEKENFIRKYFQKNVVVSKGFNLSQVSNTLFDLDVKKMLTETASDQIHVWLKTMPTLNDSDSMQVLDSITVDDAEQAFKLYQAGHSLYCRASSEFESMVVMKLANELQYGIRNVFHNDRFRRGEVEMFFSRARHFTDFHSDFQENFTMQLSGSKRWIFQESKATHPLRGCTPHFNLSGRNADVAEQQVKVLRLGNPTFSTVDYRESTDGSRPHTSVVLHAGDIMYHPAGVWHRVECLEDSISINISLTSVSYADVFCSALQQMLLENPRWRSSVFPAPQENVNYKEDALTVMGSLLSSVPSMLAALRPQDILPMPMLHEELPQNVSSFDSQESQGEDSNEGDEINDSVESGDISEDAMEEDMKELEEIGSEEDGFVEVSDGEEEEVENDDENNNRLKVVIPSVALDETLALIVASSGCSKEVSSKEVSSKKRRVDEYSNNVLFRFNPVAILITDKELASLSNPADNDRNSSNVDEYRKYIVNIGFGNETLESACRAEVIVTSPYHQWMDSVERLYQQYREQKYLDLLRYNQLETLSSTTWTGPSFSCMDILEQDSESCLKQKKKKRANTKGNATIISDQDAVECQRLLLGLYQSGLLTPI